MLHFHVVSCVVFGEGPCSLLTTDRGGSPTMPVQLYVIEELHNLYRSPNIFRFHKSGIETDGNAFKILTVILE